MTEFTSKPFQRDLLPELLSLVTSNARHRWPDVSYLMNSDIAWRLPGSNPKATLRLWYDGDPALTTEARLAGYAWLSLNSPCTLDLRTDLGWDHPIAADMLRWLETERQKYPPLYPWLIDLDSMAAWEQALTDDLPARADDHITFQVACFDRDLPRTRFLQAQGYGPTGHFHYSMLRSLETSIPEVSLPAGFQLRHVAGDDLTERVATHRDAWFKSQYNMDAYLALRRIDIYEPELDLVAVSEDGTFGSSCIGWLDKVLAVGSFEPVGTRPAFRRMGLGQQVNYEGLRRMKEKGMTHASIGTAGFNDRAFGLYRSCGFELIDKCRTYTKTDA